MIIIILSSLSISDGYDNLHSTWTETKTDFKFDTLNLYSPLSAFAHMVSGENSSRVCQMVAALYSSRVESLVNNKRAPTFLAFSFISISCFLPSLTS